MRKKYHRIRIPLFYLPTGIRKERLFLSIFLFLFFFSACIGKKSDASSNELQPLTLGLMPSMDGLPFIVAEQQGIYDSLGIEVNFVHFHSPIDRDAAFLSGSVDGTITDYTSVILQQAKGQRLGLIMQTDGVCRLLTEKESEIKTPAELKEKNIAISHHTVIEYATDLLLHQNGLTPEEVNKPEINNISLRLAMLENGQVDAAFLPEPYATIAIGSGCRPLATTHEQGIRLTGTVFCEKALKGKTEEIRRLITGYNLAVELIRSHPRSEWGQALNKIPGMTEAVPAAIKIPNYQSATRPADNDIHKAIIWLKSKNALPSTYKEANLIDTTFVPKPLKPQ